MRIFSWNVNGIRAVLRKGALQSFLEAEHPDILCLQEIKANPSQVDYDFPGYEIHWHPATRPGYSGTATLVRTGLSSALHPFSDSSVTPDSTNKDTNKDINGDVNKFTDNAQLFSTLATAEGRILVLDCEKFFLVNVYTPNSKPDLSRLGLRENTWDPGFLSLLKTLNQTKPIVTCGDFNAAHEEIDIARPATNHHSAGFTDEERRGITNLINDGFLDTFRTLHPDDIRYTWWSHWGQARAKNVGWRIDYFFISSGLKSHLKNAEIYENIMGSDHCPISITLEF